ncbi:MAG: hypothetical protein Q4D38_00185 [Planctomycetia bacterium]|nr:hypothetical protein [Planctomycetia bacterium]
MAECKPQNPSSVENMFSDWDSSPENRVTEWDCPDLSWQSDPYILTSLITEIIKQYFQRPENFQNPQIQKLLQSSTVDVSMMTHWDAKTVGVLPKVVIDFAGMQANSPFATNDRIAYDVQSSTGTYRIDWTIKHTYSVLAKTKVESMLLSSAIRHVCSLPVIRENLQFMNFRVTEQSKVQSIGEENGTPPGFVSTVATQGTVTELIYVVTADPRLKRIKKTITN